MERIHLAEDRVKCRALVNTAIIQIQIIQKISVNRYRTGSFSSTTKLLGEDNTKI